MKNITTKTKQQIQLKKEWTKPISRLYITLIFALYVYSWPIMEPLYRMQVERKKSNNNNNRLLLSRRVFVQVPWIEVFACSCPFSAVCYRCYFFFLFPLCTDQMACNTNGSSKYTVAQKISSAKSRPDKLKK